MKSLFSVLPDANSGRLTWSAPLFVAVLGLSFQPSLQAQNAAAFTCTTNQNAITITEGCPGSPRALVIPETINGLPVTSIGEMGFFSCRSLTTVVIPNSVTSIGEAAFSGCPSLTSVIVPSSVTSIREYAFLDRTSLTRIHFQGSAPTFDSDALIDVDKVTI